MKLNDISSLQCHVDLFPDGPFLQAAVAIEIALCSTVVTSICCQLYLSVIMLLSAFNIQWSIAVCFCIYTTSTHISHIYANIISNNCINIKKQQTMFSSQYSCI